MRMLVSSLLFVLMPTTRASAQMDHAAHMAQQKTGAPTHAGNEAFASIAEIVAILDADSTTDWSRVDLEALRQHLADMDDVTLRTNVVAAPVASGVRLTVTGAGRTLNAAKRMVSAHAGVLDAMPNLKALATPATNGITLTVTTRDGDPRATARLRGLGFAGIMTLGAHHAEHHLAIARGAGGHAHEHD